MITRQLFEVTGAGGDTGPPVNGKLKQVRWQPTTAQESAFVTVAVLPKAGDSGDGWNVFRRTGLNADFIQMPRMPMVYGSLTDNKGDSGWVPNYLAGDRIRVKLSDTGTGGVAGRFYVWVED